MKLCIPTKILNQHVAVLGKTGAGKSSALRHIVEHLLDHKKRVVVIDPKGDWWGLKKSADGKGKGYEDVIAFGDFKEPKASDIPINEQSGKLVAELIVTGNRPCIIGFRGWTVGNRTKFWIDFAQAIYSAKELGELYLVGDEFHNFAPKGKILSPEAGLCLHWSNTLLGEGRGLGLICLLATQRPQKLHNDVLTQCETLVAMRVIHKADRDAVQDWIEGCGDMTKGKEVLNALAGMERGEAYVWSPEIGFGPERLKFPMFETFDSFAPPQLQKKVSDSGWSSVNLDEVKEKLSTVIEEAKANDPAELKRTIATLRREIMQAQKEHPVAKESITTKDVPALTDHERKRLTALIESYERLESQCSRIENMAKEVKDAAFISRAEITFFKTLLSDKLQAKNDPMIRRPEFHIQLPKRSITPASHSRMKDVANDNGEFKLSRTQHRILDALAWFESIGTPEPTALQVGAIALIDASGGHFSNTVGPLSSSGLIERGNGTLRLTEEGRKMAVVPDNIATLKDYHEMLRSRVRRARAGGGKTVEMLDFIISHGGNDVTAEQIGEAVNIDHTGGHFSNTIGPLGTIGLIERRSGMIRPTEILFPKALV